VSAFDLALNEPGAAEECDLRRIQLMARDLFVKYFTPASMYELDVPVTMVRAVRAQV
jgi:hypothetical protein